MIFFFAKVTIKKIDKSFNNIDRLHIDENE